MDLRDIQFYEDLGRRTDGPLGQIYRLLSRQRLHHRGVENAVGEIRDRLRHDPSEENKRLARAAIHHLEAHTADFFTQRLRLDVEEIEAGRVSHRASDETQNRQEPCVERFASTLLAASWSPIHLSSCFISHSAKDLEFCQRLRGDLQAAGVRCWFAPNDLKVGDRFRDAIEDAIHVQDKLLAVLSEESVNSPWVETEVASAIEREAREGRQVLLPVRLDSAAMKTRRAWVADIRRRLHIGDFSLWRDPDHYKRAFERLLRDLQTMPRVAQRVMQPGD